MCCKKGWRLSNSAEQKNDFGITSIIIFFFLFPPFVDRTTGSNKPQLFCATFSTLQNDYRQQLRRTVYLWFVVQRSRAQNLLQCYSYLPIFLERSGESRKSKQACLKRTRLMSSALFLKQEILQLHFDQN